MSETVIAVEGLSKCYQIGAKERHGRTFRETISELVMRPLGRLRNGEDGKGEETFWALKDVSFEVKRGEVVGIIGRNGAGKSTLLKILSRITEPTSGRVRLRGRVASLLEVGTGFHAELTGRENIYLNGAMLGMKRAEITRKFEEIVAFAEVEKFLDTPVKRYSSGMYVRLAFAVAAHLEPEILIVDEVLAVGDAEFQKKCLGKMQEVSRGEGRTVLFVSHNMAAVRALCSQGVLLESGCVTCVADTGTVVERYTRGGEVRGVEISERGDRQGSGEVRVSCIRFCRDNGSELPEVYCGEPLTIQLECIGRADKRNLHVGVGIYDLFGRAVTFLQNQPLGAGIHISGRRGSIGCRIPKLPLLPGRYTINFELRDGSQLLDALDQAATLDVLQGDFFGTGKLTYQGDGGVLVEQGWSCQ